MHDQPIRGLKPFSDEFMRDVEESARDAVEAYRRDGADRIRKVAKEHPGDPKYHVALRAIADKLDQMGRSDIAKVVLEHVR